MIKLELCEEEAFFLDMLLDRCTPMGEKDLFYTEDEDGDENIDEDFYQHIILVLQKLHKARGL